MDVERLLGIAMGCIGMSRDDFCRCTPSEFYAAWESWSESRSQAEHGAWERARMQALCTLQPYSKQKLKPQDIMTFPWDASEEGRGKSEEFNSPSEMSREEIMERYRKARERRGMR